MTALDIFEKSLTILVKKGEIVIFLLLVIVFRNAEVVGSIPTEGYGFEPINTGVCGTLRFQLYGLLNHTKHRNYDVWREEVLMPKLKNQDPKNCRDSQN